MRDERYEQPADVEGLTIGMIELGGEVNEEEVTQIIDSLPVTQEIEHPREISISWGDSFGYHWPDD